MSVSSESGTAARHDFGALCLLCMLVCSTAAACFDLRNFQGTWNGPITQEELLRLGFAADARVDPLVLNEVALHSVTAALSTTDGKFTNVALVPIERVSSDALSAMTFSGDPLRSYMLFARLSTQPEADPAWMVLSLFTDERVELRIMRRNEIFGLFSLTRSP